MTKLPGLRVIGTAKERGGVISFVMDAAHPHDLTTFAIVTDSRWRAVIIAINHSCAGLA